jgi:hypothetical protein
MFLKNSLTSSFTSAAGHDGISPGIQRLSWNISKWECVIDCITYFFLTSGFVPKFWKQEIIHTISKAIAIECHDISLLPQLEKVCERIVS